MTYFHYFQWFTKNYIYSEGAFALSAMPSRHEFQPHTSRLVILENYKQCAICTWSIHILKASPNYTYTSQKYLSNWKKKINFRSILLCVPNIHSTISMYTYALPFLCTSL